MPERQRYSKANMNCSFTVKLCCSDFKNAMTTYGHLLLCPLCQELFTHPVLLPCQHSLCYGCARAQMLSDSIEEVPKTSSCWDSTKSIDSDLSSFLMNNPSPSPKPFPLLRSQDQPRLARSDVTLSNDSRTKTNESRESSFVLTTNDGLHFEYRDGNASDGSLTPARSLSKTYGLSSKFPEHKSTPPVMPVCAGTSKLRRSNSTSSVSRPTIKKCRSQQIYGTLKRSKVKSLFCPNCREMVELGKLGISGLFRNFALESIVERFRSKAKAAVAIRCGYCKPPASDATRSCLDCKLSYCNECYKTVHVWGTKKARHSFIGPTNNFTRPKVLLCPEHSNEVSLYCNKCKKSVCRMCKSGCGAHVNHSVSSAKVAFREGKERLYADLERLRIKKESIDAKMNLFGEAFAELERRHAEFREMIHSSLDDIYRILETKRSELLAKAEAEYRNNEQYLKQELQFHHHRLMAASIANFAEEVLKETDPIFFLQASQMVELKLQEVLNNLSELEEEEITFPSSNFQLDLSKVKDELEKLDLVQTQNTICSLDSVQSSSPVHCENFRWLLLGQQNPDVIFERDGKTVHIPSSYWEPCTLRGSMGYSNGEYIWHVSVTSFGARRILIGVSNLNSESQLHGGVDQARRGAYTAVVPGSVSMFDDGWAFGGSGNLDGICNQMPFSIGKHCFAIRIHLFVDRDDVTVRFFDVETESSLRELFLKNFKRLGLVYPSIIVNGKATVSLVEV